MLTSVVLTLGGTSTAFSHLITYDWQADSDDAWTVPMGAGLSKTKIIDQTPWKFHGQIQYYAEQSGPFGPANANPGDNNGE